MSSLMDASPPSRFASERLRYQKSRRFWLGLFAGSLGLHLGTMWLLPAWWRAVSPEPVSSTPLPIELVDVAEVSGGAVDAAGTSGEPLTPAEGSTAVPSAAASAPPPTTVAPTVPEISAVPPATFPDPAIAQPNPTFSDTAPIAPQPPAEFSDPTPWAAPPQDVQPSPVLPSPEPQPSPVFPPQNPQPNPTLPPTFPTGAEPPYVIGRPLPDPVEPPDPSAVDEQAGLPQGDGTTETVPEGTGLPTEGLPEYETNPQPQPSRGIAQLTAGTPGGDGGATTDIPEVAPQPQETSLNFTSDPTAPTGCVISPESVASFGETVSFQLVIDASGQVVEAYDNTVSGNPAYNELTRCLVRQWRFAPATTGGIPQQSNLPVTLSVQSAE